MKTCENCSSLTDGSYGSGRFCSAKCARGFSTKSKRAEINEKVSLILFGRKVGGKKSTLRDKVCPQCNKNFRPKNSRTVYCSKSCGAKASTGGWNNHDKVNWSAVHKRAYADGRNYVAGGTSKWYELHTSNGLIKVQGSYEVRTVKILEQLKMDGVITDWSYATDRISYEEDEKSRTYLIDFKIFDNTGFWYLEVKGYTKPTDLLKWNAVRSKGFRLEIWFDEDIKKRE